MTERAEQHFLPAADPRFRKVQDDITRDMRMMVWVSLAVLMAFGSVAAIAGQENWKSTRIAHVQP
jgi:hypothetical protein